MMALEVMVRRGDRRAATVLDVLCQGLVTCWVQHPASIQDGFAGLNSGDGENSSKAIASKSNREPSPSRLRNA